MDWTLAIEQERAALKRIVALLFALADLAESSCGRSPLVRAFVIWLLRRAEIVARDFVVGEPEILALMPASPAGDSPADAMRLALSLRDLARELDRQTTMAFAVEDGIHGDAGQAGLARFGACRLRVMDDVVTTLRQLVFPTIATSLACATGPPDIQCLNGFYPHP